MIKIIKKTNEKLIAFGLGSNLGNREKNLEKAVFQLTKKLDLLEIKQSKILINKAMLLPNSPKEWDIDFFNIALTAKINLEKFSPLKILETIKIIEKDLKRNNDQKWSPRPIDIDILLIEETKVNIENKLTIPHYDLKNRIFFTKTLNEILPNWQNLV